MTSGEGRSVVPAAGPSQDTILHRAICRVAEDFLGTAAAPAPSGIVTFAVRGFPPHEPPGPRRATFERLRAVVGHRITEILQEGLEEGRLAARLADATEEWRARCLGEPDRDAREAWEAPGGRSQLSTRLLRFAFAPHTGQA
ncbi:hypothetical protein [Pseudarthrobacter sp. AB1]|uniref:hypothetical protein n=1 Tax=Pseudarthrobacter sp. AB1 TaxID=2138309 RepID=UPI00186BA348|nr:hypothetical protein [Pseudarthrobacter sp. AB1]MBE4719507.1 hypothetical protein [Pseudarthrobacter sp. AB1]